MVREDIIRGLENAMSRGESLEHAMYSFYNAGYSKEVVEEAARALSIHLSQQESLIPQEVKAPKLVEKVQEKPKVSLISAIKKTALQSMAKPEVRIEQPKPRVVQEVSKYEVQRKNPRKTLIIILSALLVILLFVLISIFAFREPLLNLFNNLF